MKREVQILFNDKKFILTGLFLKSCKKFNVSINELYVLMYFENDNMKVFNLKAITDTTGLKENEVLDAFNSLMTKGIITIEATKDSDGRLLEAISLNNLYKDMHEILNNKNQEEKVADIFNNFERELGRPISPMEYEIIDAWLNQGTSEELIMGALKEAVYNGAKSFRYIDKIIYDWNTKGFKTIADVNAHLSKRKDSNQKAPELFDYNWLEDKDEN